MRNPLSILLATSLLFAGCASTSAPVPSSAPQPTPDPSATQETEASADGVRGSDACVVGEVKEFHRFAYPRVVAQVAELGRRHLEDELARGVEGRPAMVLDIDETSLSNWEYLASALCAPVSEFDEFAALGVSPALEPVLDLYRWAVERGVTVFFVTGRREWMREPTERNLREAGFTSYGDVFLRPTEEQGSWHNYKEEARKTLTDAGYDVLLNMGDQPADLAGGYARHSLLIPNPFYVVTPRDFGDDE